MEAGSAIYRLYVGVDVAAETFVAAWLAPGGQAGAPVAGEQTPTGFAALQRRLQATGSPPAATLVVLEGHCQVKPDCGANRDVEACCGGAVPPLRPWRGCR